MRRLYVHLPLSDGACRYYRTLLPYRHCVDLLRVRHGVQLVLSPTLRVKDLADFDGAVLLREPEADLLTILLGEQSKRQRTDKPFRLAWNIDDDLWSVPEWSPVYPGYQRAELLFARLEQLRDHADFIWTSTATLATNLGDGVWYNHVRALPNLIDLRDWPRALPWGPADGEPVRVAWAGSDTHFGDLACVNEAVRLLSDEHPGRYEFHYFGECDGDLLGRLAGRGYVFHPSVPLSDYATYLSRKVRPHVALLPLCDCPFNRSKSPIKWMEMVAAGARTVTNAPWAYPDADVTVKHATYAEYGDVTDTEKATDWAAAIERAATDVGMADSRTRLLNHAWQNDAAAGVWVDAFLELAGVSA